MSTAFTLTLAELSGVFCEALFYGIYLTTCALCIRTLLITGSGKDERWVRLGEIRRVMTSVAVVFFIICTFDVSMGLLNNVHAFIDSSDAESEFVDPNNWLSITTELCQGLGMILGDFVLIYRCWIVYGRRWLVIIPSLALYLGNLAIGGVLIAKTEDTNKETQFTLLSPRLRPWILAFYITTAIQNILTTGILIWRIWSVERQSSVYLNHTGFTIHQPRHLRRVIRAIAESGAVYTSCVFMTLVVSASQSNAFFLMADITIQMTGIAFNMILIRSSASRDRQFMEYEHQRQSTGHPSTTMTPGLGDPIVFVHQSTTQDVEFSVPMSKNNSDTELSRYNVRSGGIQITATMVKP